MGIPNSSILAGASANQGTGGYTIAKSLRLRNSASAYLTRTPASAGNRQKFTVSFWVKRSKLTTSTGQYCLDAQASAGLECAIVFGEGGSSDKLSFYSWNGTGFDFNIKTTQVFRDVSSWYHIVLSVDTTQAVASDRMKFYLNGVQITVFDTATYPAQNYSTAINNTVAHKIGDGVSASGRNFDGYVTEYYLIDGQQLTPSSFGETDTVTGVWKPKKYTGTYGTNGFHLDFSDASAATSTAIGKDSSGNGNNWTPNNISLSAGSTYDSMTDVPTLTSATAANCAVLNPLASNIALTNGNLFLPDGGTSFESRCAGTIGMTTGKFYFEVTVGGTYCNTQTGIYPATGAVANASLRYVLLSTGNKYDGTSATAYGSSFAAGTVVGVAVDMDSGKIWFSINGTWQASGSPSSGTNAAFTGLSGTYLPFFTGYNNGSGTSTTTANFGQQPFTYTPPSGFKALNTYNLPDPTIPAGNKYMDATIYSGDSASPRSVSNSGSFKPDLVWVKNRTNGLYWNVLFDSVRGAGNQLSSNQTDAELASASNVAGKVSAFNSDGFALASGNSSIASVNASGNSYVAWQWQAGQGSTSSNTSGSITSTVSVNPSAGFSIVTYTGNSTQITVGHGLGVAPKLIIVKDRGTGDWCVYHASLGAGGNLLLNSTAAFATNTTMWNNTTPTSTVFNWAYGSSSNNYVAYCWAEVAGFSKFGSYTGNGSADGPFVYTGFRPKYLMIKRIDSTDDWITEDTSRNPYNVDTQYLLANASSAEGSVSALRDLLSNGFKCRQNYQNLSGATYIYMAFAENPFKYANAR